MIRVNENFLRLQGGYLFSEVNKRVREYQAAHPEERVIRLGIGDVTKPLPQAVLGGLEEGVRDMGSDAKFHGYGPEQGYEFLREAVAQSDFASRGVKISADEIFISTGAKEDTANIQELFSGDITVAIPDPVYPVYSDSNVMAGRSGRFANGRYRNYIYLECTESNRFTPDLPKRRADLIYLCFPNNPTGQVVSREYLKMWVDYARKNRSLILFDAAYEAFIRDPDIPHSIFEIEGAREVAIEFRSLSKTAGFTGTRCAYTVVPKEVMAFDGKGKPHSLNALWFRRQSTKFNGVAYIIQKGATAVFTDEGRRQARENVDYYLENAKIIMAGLDKLGLRYVGGQNAPYIWFKTPGKATSWGFFDVMLTQCQVVGTPGSGFGKCGEGYFRLTAFGKREDVKEAMDRLHKLTV